MKGWGARILFWLMAGAIAAGWAQRAAAESVGIDGVEWSYSLDGSGNATVTGGGPDAGALEIPASLNGHPVTAIGIGAFAGRADVTAVTIPGGVTNIARQAFAHCTGMGSLSLPDGVETLDVDSFRDCHSLRDLSIPGSVENINTMAFYFCSNLVSLAFGDGVKKIGYDAFFYCHELTSVEIPDSVTTIQDKAFGSCTKLSSVRLGRGLVDMAPRAFHYATVLAEFQMGPDNPAYTVMDGVVYTKDLKKLVEVPGGKTGIHAMPDGVETVLAGGASYSKLASFVFPDSLTTIEENAFFGCSNMVSVSLGPAVTAIGRDAFTYCDLLAEFRVDTGNPSFSAVDGVLFDKDGTSLLVCPGGMAGVYEVPAGVESICSNAFRFCRHLTGVVCPEGLKRIESKAFDSCPLLDSVFLPSSLESVGGSAFRGSGLAKLSVPGSWEGGSQLDGVSLPEGCLVLYRGEPYGDPRYADWAGGFGVAAADLPAEGDPDGDGASNREEFVAGTNPLDDSEFLRLAIGVEGGKIDLAVSPAREDRTYTYSGTESLLPGGDGWQPISSQELESLSTTLPSRFFKVQAEYPEAK